MYTLLLLLAAILIRPALAGSGDEAVAKQAWPMIENGALLIDVRTAEEFTDGHIDKALNIPYENVDALVKAIGNDKTRPVVLYCRSGHRAGIALKELEGLGYTGVFNATGYEAMKATKP